jgi:hypothetical protein
VEKEARSIERGKKKELIVRKEKSEMSSFKEFVLKMNGGDEQLADSRITRKAGKSNMIRRSPPANLQGSTQTTKLLLSPSVKRKMLFTHSGGNPSITKQPTKKFRSLQECWERKVKTSQMDGISYFGSTGSANCIIMV